MSERHARFAAGGRLYAAGRASPHASSAWCPPRAPWNSQSPDSEAEALLLENNLSSASGRASTSCCATTSRFPTSSSAAITEWPQLAKHRGTREPANEFFGPFASAPRSTARSTRLQTRLPAALLFGRRLHDPHAALPAVPIKRCTAPCVGRIDKAQYDAIVDDVRGFLGGRKPRDQQTLSQRMEQASANLEFESARHSARPHSGRWRTSRRTSRSACRRSTRPIYSPPMPKAVRSASRCSSCRRQNLGNRAYFPESRP